MAYAVPFLRKYLMVDPARFLQWRQADRAEWRERGGAPSFTFQTVTHISFWRDIQKGKVLKQNVFLSSDAKMSAKALREKKKRIIT